MGGHFPQPSQARTLAEAVASHSGPKGVQTLPQRQVCRRELSSRAQVRRLPGELEGDANFDLVTSPLCGILIASRPGGRWIELQAGLGCSSCDQTQSNRPILANNLGVQLVADGIHA